MYNYQKFLKDQRLRENFSQLYNQQLKQKSQKQSKEPNMIENHKKRIQGFLLMMLDKPIKIDSCCPYKYQPRKYEPAKIISQKGLRLKPRNEKERIKEVSKQNTIYDEIPFKNVSNHQFKCYSKVKNPMKYKSKTSIYRIKEQLQSQRMNIFDYPYNIKLQKKLKDPTNQSKQNFNQYAQNLIKKSILPQLHRKTHFKSLKSIQSQSLSCFNSIFISKQTSPSLVHNIQNALQTPKQQKLNQKNQCQKNAEQALIKCGIIKEIKNKLGKFKTKTILNELQNQ